jgi:hypothetical protein
MMDSGIQLKYKGKYISAEWPVNDVVFCHLRQPVLMFEISRLAGPEFDRFFTC